MGLRGKSENLAFLECRISRIAESLSVYAVRGKLSGIVSKNTSFGLLSLDKGIVSEMNCCRGEMLFANEG